MDRLRDIIDVPDVKTVIQLSDIHDKVLKRRLAEDFILTSEVYSHLKTICGMIRDDEGAGIFLEGNFGSGKSHFLTIISLLFNYREAWQPLLTQEPDLTVLHESLSLREYLTAEVSLVEYSSKTGLEEIIAGSIVEAYRRKYEAPLFDPLDPNKALPERREFYENLEEKLRDRKASGLILLIDELSEFLRSKPESRSFNEDIRFLQYLGEKAPTLPVWIVATLQESIEDTGQTTQEAFNKIKDRYPVRLFLTGAHIEELIARRLIKVKTGKEKVISRLYHTFKTCFPQLPVDEERFSALYPIHPATVSFLDNLKPLFSQHRGVVDFIHYQLKGDPVRNIEGMLHLPCDHLLTSERIFDHFRVRIKERVELNPFVAVVYKYYEDEMKGIFDDEADRNIAFRILKILILVAISPVKKRRTVSDVAQMLLHRITDLESSINYRYIRDIMERLLKEGAYISMDKDADPLKDHFYINLEADIGLLVRRSTEYMAGSLFEDDARLFTRLKGLLDDPRLPLKEYKVSERTKIKLLWQSTPRGGIFLLEQIDRLTPERLDEIILELQETEADFAGLMGTTHRLNEQRAHLEKVILPHLKEKNAFYIVFWLPGIPENGALKETLAHLLLSDRYAKDATERGKEIRDFISGIVSNEKRLVKEKFLDAYHGGELFSILSGEEHLPESLKFKTFHDLLSSLAEGLLEARYPRHSEISPYTSFATRDQLQEVAEDLLKKGEITLNKGTRHGLKRIVEGFLLPMKVVKSVSNGFRMVVDPSKSILVKRFLELSGDGRPSLEEIYRKLRKGDFGLSRLQFELLSLALIFSGHLVPYSGGRRKNPDEISIYNLRKIDEVSKGEILSAEFQADMEKLPFIPKRHKKTELTLSTQKELWRELTAIKGDMTGEIENLQEKIKRASEYRALAGFDLMGLKRDMDDLRLLTGEIKTSYPPREGIERFLRESRNHPFVGRNFFRFEAAKRFFAGDMERYLFISSYVLHPDLFIPEGEEYETIRLQLDDIKETLNDNAPYLTEGYMENLRRSFSAFLEGYAGRYQKEHQRATSPEGLLPYSRIKDSLRYRVLSGLSRIEYVSVKNDRVKVDRMLAEVSNLICSGFSMETIHQRPVCTCGFHLGDRPELPGLSTIESTIDRGIREYIPALSEAKNRERLISYCGGLKEVGKIKIADSIKRLLDFDASDISNDPEVSLKEMENILNSEVIRAINDAFSGKVMVVSRDIDELYENMIERSFPKERLVNIFREWLQGGEDLKEETYIRVTSSKRGGFLALPHPSHYHTLSEIVQDRYPELTGLLKKLGDDEFNLIVFLSLWGKNQEIDADKLLPFIGKVLGRETGDTQEFLTNHEHLAAAAQYLMTNREEEADSLIEDAGRFLEEKNADMTLFGLIDEKDCLKIVEREDVFPFVAISALKDLLKKIEERSFKMEKRVIEEAIFRQKERGTSKRMNKEEIFRTLIHAINLKTSLRDLPNMTWKDKDFQFWEDIYLSSLSGMFYDYCYLYHATNRFGIMDDACLYRKKKAVDAISTESGRAFEEFYLSVEGGRHPVSIGDVPGVFFQRFKKSLNKDKGYFILLDCMRWDMWEYIKENTFITRSLDYRILEEIPIWAHLPTTTEGQMRSLLDSTTQPGMVAERGATYSNIRDSQSSLADAYEEIEFPNAIKIVKFGFTDNKVHQSRDDLVTLFREIAVNMEVSVKNYMERIPRGSLIFLFSDHGFVENLRFKGDKDEPRYLHGGATPWEVIVPLIVILKM